MKLPPEQRRPEMVGEWLTLPASAVEEDPEGTLALVRQSFEYVQTAPARPKPPREERRFRKRQHWRRPTPPFEITRRFALIAYASE